MRVLVVYESMFGNTHAVADAIAAGLLSAGHVVDVCAVEEADAAAVDLADGVVIGGPTHAHGMSSAPTRKGAQDEVEKSKVKVASGESDHEVQLDEHATGEGLRDWFHHLADGRGRPAAAFDTRMHLSPVVSGSAARGINRRLHRHGWTEAAAPESFFVMGTDGPLAEGELDRARHHGEVLAAALADHMAST
jgi:flavodoxin